MIRKTSECRHCGSLYWLYASGGSHHDARWCPSCLAVAKAAVEKLPVLFEDRYIASTEVTRKELLAEEAACVEAGKPRRVFPGLFSDDDSSLERLISIKGKGEFLLSTWRKNSKYSIAKRVRWDIVGNCEAKRDWPRG